MRNLALCTCEKVIIDKQGAHSLINLILNAEIQHVGEIPPNAVSSSQWFIYVMWVPAPEDVGEKFEEFFQIYWPDGEKFFEGSLEFTQPDESVQQVSYSLIGFPVGQIGNLRILTWLDKRGNRVSDVIETNIRVKHPPQQVASTVPAT
jgi:hypothetical protein